MIDLYYWPTPNGHKITIFLEETGLPYEIHPVDIGKGEQFDSAFLRISPNNKMPAIIDREGPRGKPLALFESGAILIYLAEKTGQLMPTEAVGRYQVIQWLMFQMGGVGPMLGQNHHFRRYAREKIPYAIERYTNEARRLYGVIDKRLAEVPYLAGDYSIADIATFPWLRGYEGQGQKLEDFPNLNRWFEEIARRPAVIRGLAVMANQPRPQIDNPETWSIMFGAKQFER